MIPAPNRKGDRPDPQELEQLRRFATLSFADRVRWLEEAHRLVLRLGARKAPARDRPAE